ncbi:MAG: hypothetical protein JWO56_306, partial [Acidobacteria bacterium]|nr:hypothetical protein [Acidobacteriota bacterium]
ATIADRTVTLEGTSIDVQPGDKWQGVYRFDTFRAVNGETVTSSDPIRIGVNGVVSLQGPASAGQYLELLAPISGTSVTVTGNVSVPSITATTLTVKSGAVLTVPANYTTPNTLNLNVSGALTIEAGGAIDVSGRGYSGNRTYPGASPSTGQTGGVHIGLSRPENGGVGTPFGSVTRAQEAGAGGGDLGIGGGIVRIVAGTWTNDGALRANGVAQNSRTGAGGSIWVTATNVGGNGAIEARGGDEFYPAGGGGAISIEYSGTQSGTLLTAGLLARGGKGNHDNNRANGGPGSIYVKGPASIYGDLLFDNKNMLGSSAAAELPALGSGAALAGSAGATLVTDRSAAIPPYFEGHWVEITSASGTLKGTWRIDTVNGTAAALKPNGSETINVARGDSWAGIYRFDSVTLRNADLRSPDRVDSTNGLAADATSHPLFNTAAPKISVAKIVITGANITGSAGAVTDDDQPVHLVLTNVRSGDPFPVNAAFDGSFTIAVTGLAGDTFAIKATDSHASPLTSRAAVNGALGSGAAPVPTVVSVVPAQSTALAGTFVSATVTLNAVVPADTSVALSSSDPVVASVPSTVIVAGGTAATSTSISTTHAGPVTIRATLGASTATAALTVSGCSTATATAPASVPLDVTWINDSGASTATGSFVTAQAALGSSSLRMPYAAGIHAWSATPAAPLSVASTDNLVVYALLDPCYPPRELSLTWTDAGGGAHIATWGEDLINADTPHFRAGSMPAAGQWTRLAVPAGAIGAGGASLASVTVELYGGEAYFDAFGRSSAILTAAAAYPSFPAGEVLYLDDTLPLGAHEYTDANSAPFSTRWSTDQVASGTRSHVEPDHTGFRYHLFADATTVMPVVPGDVLFTWVFIDPAHPPREIMLWWNDGSQSSSQWDHRAFWGGDLAATSGSPGNAQARYSMGALPEAGKWVRLEVPAYAVGLDNASFNGMLFGSFDGQVWFDRSGKHPRTNVALGKTATMSAQETPDSGPERAVDGNVSGNVAGGALISTTLEQPQSWWQVDLGAIQPIDGIQIWNRTDTLQERLAFFWVFVSDTPFASTDLTTTIAQPGVSGYYWSGGVGGGTYYWPHRTGRYVRVQLVGNGPLNLAEVQVFTPAMPHLVNLAGGRTASQISNYYFRNPATSAVDCQLESFWGYAATAGSTANDWWELDLGAVQDISNIDLRKSFELSDSLNFFYLLLSDQPFVSRDLTQTLAQPSVYAVYGGNNSSERGFSFAINRTARYVRVQNSRGGVLAIGEARVWSKTPLPAAIP